MNINAQRLMDDLATLRSFGATGPGVVRPSLSEVDMRSREWLVQRMTQAGLEASIDGVGNVIGRSRNPGPALLVGSHSDTQPRGGWLDGALGVIYGLEAARTLAEHRDTRELAVDPVSWIDEEGTFFSCLGSRSFCGVLDDADVSTATDAHGLALTDALRNAGRSDVPRAYLDPERHVAYLEAHIEQGPYLEQTGKRVGVVTSIVGIRGCVIHFTGEQNHAGTTPMALRKDAGMALFRFAAQLDDRLRAAAGPKTVWTMGRATLSPGAPSIIAGAAELTLQFRDPDAERLEMLDREVSALADEASAQGPVQLRVTRSRSPIAPTLMDEALQADVARAAEQIAPGAWMHMPSAAGHDPMVIAHHIPCGMLFVPSINGISHDFAEDTAEDDIILGAQVFAEASCNALRRLRAAS